MATLLTGASGLLGANLAHRLCSRGGRPRLLLRTRSDRRGLHGLAYEDVPGDILDPASLVTALRGVDEVYHVAGLVRLDPASSEQLRRVNVEGTRNVLAAARAAGVRRVVHVSSIAAVGHGPLAEPATEETAYNFEGTNPYHQSKREAEQLALAAAAEGGLEVVVANPTFLVGAYDVRPTSGELLLRVASGWLVGYPSGGNNFACAADVAAGLILLMERGRSGERYILGGENLTYREFLTQCAEEAGVSPPSLPLPRGLLRAAGMLGDRLGRLSPESFRHLSASFLESLWRPSYASSRKAQHELGYEPRPVRLGIRAAYRWFQEEGILPRDRPLSPRGVANG